MLPLSIKFPSKLISAIDRIRERKSRSEFIRLAVERHMKLEQTTVVNLLGTPQESMIDILRKRDNGLLLSPADIEFLAIRTHETYMYSALKTVSAFPINEVLRLFLKIRKAIDSNNMANNDIYFISNLGAGKGSLEETVYEVMVDEDQFTDSSSSEFKSRNLEVITRYIKDLKIDALNQMIAPHIDTIISLACRSFWQRGEGSKDFLESQEYAINEYGEHTAFKLEGSHLSCHVNANGEMSAALLLKSKDVWISLNSFLEVEEFFILVNAFVKQSGKNKHYSGTMFSIQAEAKDQVAIFTNNFRVETQTGLLEEVASLYTKLQDWPCYQQAQKRYGII